MLLYRAARKGAFGKLYTYGEAVVADALFVYLDGTPDDGAIAALRAGFTARPWVCLTDAWDKAVRARFPEAIVYRRWRMKPLRRFVFPQERALPAGYEVRAMDEAAFDRHPFGHGANYPSFTAFRTEGSGAVAWRDGEIVASASSFWSLDGEVELDVSTQEAHRSRGLAGACVAAMLRDCQARGITVHWDAQNETSRRLAERFGFEVEEAYDVYWVEGGASKAGCEA